MRNRLIVVLTLVTAAAFGLVFARQLILSRGLDRTGWTDTPVRVLTYGTFVANQGPGATIFKKFETEHHAKLEVVVAQDPGLMLERLKLGGEFDLVIGLDALAVARARREFAWRDLKYDRAAWHVVPARASDRHFAAFDWSPLTFVYRADHEMVPRTFDELTDPVFAGAFTVTDPRGTTPGRQFASWVKGIKREQARAWLTKFRPNVNAVTPTWTAAYGLFERGQTRFVWTFLTSLAFHWGVEKKREYRPLTFPEGHPVQVELAGVPANCRQCALGEALLRTLLTPAAQVEIMTRNFMLPVVKGVEAGTVYAELPELAPHLTPPLDDLTEWNDVFAR